MSSIHNSTPAGAVTRTTRPAKAPPDTADAITINGEPYVTAGRASAMLADGTGLSELQANWRLRKWREAGQLTAALLHEKFAVYRVSDLERIRAELTTEG